MSGWLLALRVAGMGWYVAVCTVLGILGGTWLDNKLGTSPLFILSGILLGLAVAFYGVYRMLVPLLENTGHSGQKSERT